MLAYSIRLVFPLNTTCLDSLKEMIEAIGIYDAGLKPSSYYEMRVSLLKKESNYTNGLLKGYKESWATHGCSIMSDV